MSTLPTNISFPKEEEAIAAKWEKEKAFQTQNELSAERGDEEFTFYDGPPFATGLPHYGHILAGTIKDVVTRYAAMNGKSVSRRAGWDCHGLPVEHEIDTQLQITDRQQILDMGIDVYNAKCRSIVTRYTSEWRTTITRLGRWIDFDNDYKTMDPNFMESVWWVFKELYNKNLVYQGYKVMPFSTQCGTPLSNFEAGLNYKMVSDPAVVVHFPLLEEPGVSFLAWTTTPWTLPSNIALCVKDDMKYVKVYLKEKDLTVILAESRLCQLFPQMNSKKWKKDKAKDLFEIQETFLGSTLVGKRYQPLFDYFKEDENAGEYWRVLSDNYVTDDAGTGIVHQAPAFGEDDYRVCLKHGVIQKGKDLPCPVNANGKFTEQVPEVQGLHVKEADKKLMEILKEMGRLVQKDSLNHQYPYCWRSNTPLIYKAVPSWFVKVEEIRDKIVKNNQEGTYWVPNSVKVGRFHNWLVDARDWAVSRNRFWGTPIPIWASDDMSEVECVGSVQELFELSGVKVEDLHRESIDHITIPSKKNPGTVLRRIDEVFDCWFESGSMPYAQKHYPFENKERFEKGFPADFIAEGLDQTRGWFYTLMVLATALFDKPAFKNLIVNGLVQAADGKKMSKSLKNYPDPMKVINNYGADAVRMYLINSPVVRAESLKFQEEGVRGVVKEVFLPWYNALRFLLQNIERRSTEFVPDIDMVRASTNPTDIWISAATQKLIKFVREEMDAYRLYTVTPALVSYVSQLTNWYVRLNRDRLKGTEGDEKDCDTGLQVLYDVLLNVTLTMSPFTPFITEFFYQQLRKFQPSYSKVLEDKDQGKTNPPECGKSDSVHYLMIPSYDATRLNENAVEAMETLQSIVELGRNVREKRLINMKTPVRNVVVVMLKPSDNIMKEISGPLKSYILSELNAWELTIVDKEAQHNWVKLSLKPDFSKLGRKFGKKMKAAKEFITNLSHADAVSSVEAGTLEVEGIAIDTKTEVESVLSFAKEGENWESASSSAGDLVVAIDCTQDEAILSAGRARELITNIQKLRKNAGLDLKDVVEYFFDENNTASVIESTVSTNVKTFKSKFKGIVPLPKRFASKSMVPVISEKVNIDGSEVDVIIGRPALAMKDDLDDISSTYLSTIDPASVEAESVLSFTVDGVSHTLHRGKDFWGCATAKLEATSAVSWL